MQSRQRTLKRWLICAIAALLASIGLIAVACRDGQGEAVSPDCAKVESVAVPTDRGLTALVVDNSASTAAGDLPPRTVTELQHAQSRGDALALIAVDGAGKQPAVVKKIALEPHPGVDSPTADRARPIVLNCVELWARDEQMQPTAPGSAILDAIAVAARQNPSTLLVVSDGLNNVGPFDLNVLGFDTPPGPLADDLLAGKNLAPELKGRKIIWAGAGESELALPQPARTNLTALWTALLVKAGATVDFDSQMGKRTPAPEHLPADPLAVPEVETVPSACGVSKSIPASLLFPADSAKLLPGADEVLREIADDLRQRPGTSALIEGHTAAVGDEPGRQRLSDNRAEEVAAALTGMGIERSRLAPIGLGSKRLKDAQTPAAAVNRRVEITVNAKECGR